MTLGCVIIFLCVIALFRRRMRAKRAKRTAEFAAAKNIDSRGIGWRGRLGALFSRGPRIPKEEKVALRVARLRNLEEERHMATLGKLGVLAPSSSSVPLSQYARSVAGKTGSLYSQVTGVLPRVPVPRLPVGVRSVERGRESWRYSGTTISSSRSITEAQRYELDEGSSDGGYSGHPAGTESRNPFRKEQKCDVVAIISFS
jgi:hypothetical protein